MILETIYTILTSKSPQIAGNRIFPGFVPQGQLYPAIVYQRDGGTFLRTHDGHNGLVRSSFQIDCYAKSISSASALATRVKSALIDYATRPVNMIGLDNEFDLFEAETELYRVCLQFTVWHFEED